MPLVVHGSQLSKSGRGVEKKKYTQKRQVGKSLQAQKTRAEQRRQRQERRLVLGTGTLQERGEGLLKKEQKLCGRSGAGKALSELNVVKSHVQGKGEGSTLGGGVSHQKKKPFESSGRFSKGRKRRADVKGDQRQGAQPVGRLLLKVGKATEKKECQQGGFHQKRENPGTKRKKQTAHIPSFRKKNTTTKM